MTYTQFRTVVGGLLQQLGLQAKADMLDESGFCTVTVGTVQIELVGLEQGFINLFCFPGTGVKPLALSAPSMALLIAVNRYQPVHPAITASILNGSPAKLMLWSRLPLAEARPPTLGNLFARFTDTSITVQAWLKAGAPSGGSSKPSTLAKLQSLSGAPLLNKKETDSDQSELLPETLLNDPSRHGSSLASIVANYHVQLGSEGGREQSAQLIRRAMNQESGFSLIMNQLKAHANRR